MKLIKLNKSILLAITAALVPCSAFAGTPVKASKEVTPPVEEKEKSVVSGWISFDLNSHFMSYGLDVWAAGNSWRKGTFNPSLELSLALPVEGLSAIVGTFWDINNNATSNIGKYIQEVDVWAGLSYTWKEFSTTVLYQAWNYASQTESVLDVILKYANNTFLNPALTIHTRMNASLEGPGGDGPGNAGVFFVPNLSYNWKIWELTITPSAAMGFCTTDFHGADGGYAYTALGVAASVPIPYLPGNWELHGSVTYYNTNKDVIPTNPDDNFLTANVGVKLSF
ncbi:MAG: hypothetical protein N2035_05730 [Chthoniobacterales bacterium]|nr:hypothetical protein [Chthoniobacterales bacterium]